MICSLRSVLQPAISVSHHTLSTYALSTVFIFRSVKARPVKLQNQIPLFNVYGSMHCKNILIYIQQDATLHSLFYLETALRVSGGTTTHHQERKQLYLQRLVFVRPLLVPAATAAGNSNGVTNTRCCKYSFFALLMMGGGTIRNM